jgi:beta-N-acetylhexosaminidase
MKAVADHYAVPDAAVLAIEAGCDCVLVCGSDHDLQAATLEALIHAVEEDRLVTSRVDDALKRQQRVKERFLVPSDGARPLQARRLRTMLGRDEHLAVAEEMSRFL